ncbi:signal recognition particle-docking protein FtsY [Neoehrlichia mikurensis]|uniref:Signal recognition particle-docking protein FtsY n=1 Tax=Neoehrlichia mikurensis TaxID=89586 RepID=A0A9Q9BVT7_9RICK|nr:signal recognition particle-docking protein FtsY [Neoehrlichia mikurensis]UTO55781.1 signal recognition particle-docking protein FtsY [Neoehrlichia mikurensis]UTO56696.1 signal recognition particle-docking protein FtsY [Neoehrlichia mikurensis]
MNNDKGLFSTLKNSLIKTSSKLNEGIKNIFITGKKVDQKTLNELYNLLITMDIGHQSAEFLIKKISDTKLNNVDYTHIKEMLAQEIECILSKVSHPISITHKPHIIMLCGINGNGKTTTIGKLAYKFRNMQKSVIVGACDTFRAAATSQLKIWTENVQCPIITGSPGADPASVAYQTINQALAQSTDIVLIDTAGRLHNHKNLMEELAKINRIIKKHNKEAPHNTILILDATVGQNAFAQVEAFLKFVNLNGIIITKLDGTAKGGIVIKIAQKYNNINLHAIGIGEKMEDLKDFSAQEFAKSLLDID